MKRFTNNLKTKPFKTSPLFVVLGFFLVVYTLIMISLFGYALISSFKDLGGFIDDPVGLPKEWHWENYLRVLEGMAVSRGKGLPMAYIEHMFLNSIVYSVGCALANTICTTLMAYACATHKNFVSKTIYALVIFMIIFPIIGSLPSELQMAKTLGLYDSMLGNFFLKFSFGNVYFLVLYEAFRAMPKDYIEAAQLDGANQFQIMMRVMLPMARNTIGTIMLVLFVGFWNDYQTPLVYLPSKPTVALGLLLFTHNTSGIYSGEPLKLAAAIMVLIPILLIYAFFQKSLMGNLTVGGVKG